MGVDVKNQFIINASWLTAAELARRTEDVILDGGRIDALIRTTPFRKVDLGGWREEACYLIVWSKTRES